MKGIKITNRITVILTFTVVFLSFIFYKVSPYYFSDTQQERTLYRVIELNFYLIMRFTAVKALFLGLMIM